jgi:hypothetical protein
MHALLMKKLLINTPMFNITIYGRGILLLREHTYEKIWTKVRLVEGRLGMEVWVDGILAAKASGWGVSAHMLLHLVTSRFRGVKPLVIEEVKAKFGVDFPTLH